MHRTSEILPLRTLLPTSTFIIVTGDWRDMSSKLTDGRNLSLLLTIVFALLFVVFCFINTNVAVIMLIVTFLLVVFGVCLYGGVEGTD